MQSSYSVFGQNLTADKTKLRIATILEARISFGLFIGFPGMVLRGNCYAVPEQGVYQHVQ